MDASFWNATASAVARFVEVNHPNRIPCKVRIDYTTKSLVVTAFVGNEAMTPCAGFISQLAAQGYVILGQGMTDGLLHWAVVLETRSDEAWADRVAYESFERLPVACISASVDQPSTQWHM